MVAEQTKERTKASLPSPAATKHKMAPRHAARARRGTPMAMAVMAAALLVALLCVYVYAYARVTTAGFELSRLSRALRQAEQEEEALRAEISRLSLPSALERRAQAMGMTPAPAEAAQVLPAAPEDRAAVALRAE